MVFFKVSYPQIRYAQMEFSTMDFTLSLPATVQLNDDQFFELCKKIVTAALERNSNH